MGVILEIRNGSMAGKVIAVTTGQSVTLGRASGRADVPFPQDTFMSGVHFAVECGTSGCRVVDRKSSNGTFLNGARIQDAMLANGDEIKAGQTVFAVKILSDEKIAAVASKQGATPAAPLPASRIDGRALAEPVGAKPNEAAEAAPRRAPQQAPQSTPPVPSSKSDQPGREPAIAPPSTPPSSESKSPAVGNAGGAPKPDARRVPTPAGGAERGAAAARQFAFSVMGWSFPTVPAKWQVQEGLGLQSEQGGFPSSLAATQESLGGITLQQFVEFQINMLKSYLREARIEPAVPPSVAGTEDRMAVDVKHKTKDGKELVYRRIYVQSSGTVGVLTVTALADEIAPVLESLSPALNGMEFRKGS